MHEQRLVDVKLYAIGSDLDDDNAASSSSTGVESQLSSI